MRRYYPYYKKLVNSLVSGLGTCIYRSGAQRGVRGWTITNYPKQGRKFRKNKCHSCQKTKIQIKTSAYAL